MQTRNAGENPLQTHAHLESQGLATRKAGLAALPYGSVSRPLTDAPEYAQSRILARRLSGQQYDHSREEIDGRACSPARS